MLRSRLRSPLRSLLAGLLVGLILTGSTVIAQPFPPQVQLAINQVLTGVSAFTTLRLATSAYANWGATTGATGYGLRDNAGTLQFKNAGGSWQNFLGSAGGGAPADATYWVRTADATLTNESVMGALATGLVINTTTTGIPTAYAGTTCTNQFPRSLSAVGAATCASVALATDVVGQLPVANGGTGLASGTSGGVLAYTASGTLASSAALVANQIVLGGGAGVVPATLGSLGTSTTILHGNAAGAPTFGPVGLTTDVSGILPGANGGTGNGFFAVTGPTTSLKTFTFPNASATVLTSATAITPAQGGTGITSYTIGDLLQASGATTLIATPATSTGNAWISGGVATVSAWGKIGLTTHISGTLAATNGGTGFASYTVGSLLYASSTTALAERLAVAVGSVLISQGVSTAPVWSSDVRMTTLRLGANVALSSATPTIDSGFGTTPSVTAGTAAAFRVDVGTGGAASSGVVAVGATASNGWNCSVEDLTAVTANATDRRTVQLSSTTTTVTVENQTISTGAALAWTASDILAFQCTAF